MAQYHVKKEKFSTLIQKRNLRRTALRNLENLTIGQITRNLVILFVEL